jgi:hypothetical protein
MIDANDFKELVVNLFIEMQKYYEEAAENDDLDKETTFKFLQSHGMEPRSVEAGTKEAYRAAIEPLAFEWLRGDAVDFDQKREIIRECFLPEWLEARELDAKARALLNLPECWCEETPCPEVLLNMLGHPNEEAVRTLYEDAGRHMPNPESDAKAEEELALRAGQAGKAAFEEALKDGKSDREANEIAIAAAQAVRDAEEAEF